MRRTLLLLLVAPPFAQLTAGQPGIDTADACASVTRGFPSDQPLLPWCVRYNPVRYPNGNCPSEDGTPMNPGGGNCPGPACCGDDGPEQCFNSSVANAPCPEGYYCGKGSAAPEPCGGDLGASPEDRCPEGKAAHLPSLWWGLLAALFAVWLPVALILEGVHIVVVYLSPKKRRAAIDRYGKTDLTIDAAKDMVFSWGYHAQSSIESLIHNSADRLSGGGKAAKAGAVDDDDTENDKLGLTRAVDFVRLRWRELSFHVGAAQVLAPMDGDLQQGELVALMGESGSGKSTLLNVLGGRAGYGTRKGELLLNGKTYYPDNCKHLLGYVQQAYILFDELSVFENLMYSANMRSPFNETLEQRMTRVEANLQILGLSECRDFVLAKNLGLGRLSGGQMRRVGIGVETVTEPSILLLDEPTSALDAVNTRIVVGLLRKLSHAGMLVVASIHQPSLKTFEQFDRLVLLHGGHLVYGGAAGATSVSYFDKLGYPLPERQNPADFFIEICFGFVKSSAPDGKPSVADLPASWGSAYQKLLEEEAARLPARQTPCSLDELTKWIDEHPATYGTLDASVVPKLFAIASEGGASPTWGAVLDAIDEWKLPPSDIPHFSVQFLVCFVRYLLKRVRLRKGAIAVQFVMIVFSVAIGLVVGTPITETKQLMLVGGVSMFSLLSAVMAIPTVQQGPADELFVHESAGGVRQSAEVIARFTADLIWWAPLPLLFALPFGTITAYHGIGQCIGIHWALWWAQSGFGYLAAVLFKSSAAIVVVGVVLFMCVFMSGAIAIMLTQGPVARGVLSISPSRWALHAILMTHATSSPFDVNRGNLEKALIGLLGYMPGKPQLDQLKVIMGQPNGNAILQQELTSNLTSLLQGGQRNPTQEVVYQLYTNIIANEKLLGAEKLQDHLTFCAEQSAGPQDAALVALAQEIYDEVPTYPWLGICIGCMVLIGLVLRIATALVFISNSTPWKEWRFVRPCVASYRSVWVRSDEFFKRIFAVPVVIRERTSAMAKRASGVTSAASEEQAAI